MKIVCLARNLGMGGMERQISGLALLLHNQGHEVSVLTYRKGTDFFGLDLPDAGIGRLRLLKGCEPTPCYEIRLAQLFSHLRPDIVIAYGQGASRKAAIAHLLWPKFRLVVSERTANPRQNPFDLYKMLLYNCSADIIMTNSYALTSLLSKAFPMVRRKLVTVPNFVSDKLFVPLHRSPVHGPLTIVTTARVSGRKNIIRYIYAVKMALERGADVRAVWYGRRNDSRRRCLKCDNLIRRLGLQNHFMLLDAVPNPEKVYGTADAFCLPSIYEGTSNSLAEAMSCGLPVICADAGDNLRYVHDGIDGYVFNSRDVSSIADAIVKICNAPSCKLEEMGRESRRIITRELSVGIFSERMNNLINSISGNGKT